MEIALSLAGWAAWAPDKTRLSDWQAWADDEPLNSADPEKPDISAVPATHRRRLSTVSRMAFATAAACSGAQREQVSCIFASRHGELARTIGIVDAILANEDVSPTDFSHSVHSTSLGLFSIFVKNREASTLITAGEDTFGMALIEVDIYLSRFPDRPVLLVFFDEELPAPLDSAAHGAEQSPEESFSIALLFDAAAPNTGIQFSHNKSGQGDGHNPALDFLKFHLSGSQKSEVSTNRSRWQWRRLESRDAVTAP